MRARDSLGSQGCSRKQAAAHPLLPPLILIALQRLFANSHSLPPDLHQEVYRSHLRVISG